MGEKEKMRNKRVCKREIDRRVKKLVEKRKNLLTCYGHVSHVISLLKKYE